MLPASRVSVCSQGDKYAQGTGTARGEGDPLIAAAFREDSNKHNAVVSSFDSTDGFSALFLVQGISVALLFFVLPVFSGTSGRSSDRQFLWEESVVFGLMLLALVCLIVDERYQRQTRKVGTAKR
jgi:hypothetical protein